MNKPFRTLLPLPGIFLIFSLSILFFSGQLQDAGFDTRILTAANILFFLISVLSFFIQLRGMRNTNPHVFVRSVMAGMMVKMLVCIIATFAYVQLAGKNFNKRSVFVSLLLYLVYLAVEVVVVTKMNKKKNA
jgi:hypothetical protein